MNKKLKFVSIILSGFLLSSVFTGCQTSTDNSITSSPTNFRVEAEEKNGKWYYSVKADIYINDNRSSSNGINEVFITDYVITLGNGYSQTFAVNQKFLIKNEDKDKYIKTNAITIDRELVSNYISEGQRYATIVVNGKAYAGNTFTPIEVTIPINGIEEQETKLVDNYKAEIIYDDKIVSSSGEEVIVSVKLDKETVNGNFTEDTTSLIKVVSYSSAPGLYITPSKTVDYEGYSNSRNFTITIPKSDISNSSTISHNFKVFLKNDSLYGKQLDDVEFSIEQYTSKTESELIDNNIMELSFYSDIYSIVNQTGGFDNLNVQLSQNGDSMLEIKPLNNDLIGKYIHVSVSDYSSNNIWYYITRNDIDSKIIGKSINFPINKNTFSNDLISCPTVSTPTLDNTSVSERNLQIKVTYSSEDSCGVSVDDIYWQTIFNANQSGFVQEESFDERGLIPSITSVNKKTTNNSDEIFYLTIEGNYKEEGKIIDTSSSEYNKDMSLSVIKTDSLGLIKDIYLNGTAINLNTVIESQDLSFIGNTIPVKVTFNDSVLENINNNDSIEDYTSEIIFSTNSGNQSVEIKIDKSDKPYYDISVISAPTEIQFDNTNSHTIIGKITENTSVDYTGYSLPSNVIFNVVDNDFNWNSSNINVSVDSTSGIFEYTFNSSYNNLDKELNQKIVITDTNNLLATNEVISITQTAKDDILDSECSLGQITYPEEMESGSSGNILFSLNTECFQELDSGKLLDSSILIITPIYNTEYVTVPLNNYTNPISNIDNPISIDAGSTDDNLDVVYSAYLKLYVKDKTEPIILEPEEIKIKLKPTE